MNIKNLTPLHNYIVIKPDDAPATTESGLYLPENIKQLPEIGVVLAAGAGIHQDGIWIPTEVVEGQIVLFMKYAGVKSKLNNEKVLLLKETDILAIVNEPE